jgi:hypothetical protein
MANQGIKIKNKINIRASRNLMIPHK